MANRINCWFSLVIVGDGVSTQSIISFKKQLQLTSWSQSYGPIADPPESVAVTSEGLPVAATVDSTKLTITTPVFTGIKTFLVNLFFEV